MANVRIYKVAELLGTTSQEVSALLKRDHGIEVKSASSTIEEVVGRSFVERLARQRNIALPSGDIFAEAPVAKGKKGAPPAKKAAEPAKPAAPVLPPPRLVKMAKPAALAEPELEPAVEEEPPADTPPPPTAVVEAPVRIEERDLLRQCNQQAVVVCERDRADKRRHRPGADVAARRIKPANGGLADVHPPQASGVLVPQRALATDGRPDPPCHRGHRSLAGPAGDDNRVPR